MTSELKRTILEKTIVLSSRYGFDRINYQEIAFEVDLPEETILELFPTREELMDSILEYLAQVIEHYNPSAEDIDEMLRTQSPTKILQRFVSAYRMTDNRLTRSIYRFIMMEQSRNDKIRDFAFRYLMDPPSDNARFVIDHLVARGAVPPCNSRILAEMWNRTSLVFEMLTTHGIYASEDYVAMTDFYIRLIVRGVRTAPVSILDAHWKPRPGFHEILADTPSAKQNVMLTALDLFGRFGYLNVSMSQIAQECGLSLISTYRQYPTKSAIMNDIVALMLNTDRIDAGDSLFTAVWLSQDQEQIVLTLGDSYSNIEDELVIKLYRILFREQYYNEDLKDFLVGSLYRDIENIQRGLEDLVREGRIPPCEAKKIATSYVFCMCSFSIDATLGVQTNREARLETIAVLVSLILNGHLDHAYGGSQL